MAEYDGWTIKTSFLEGNLYAETKGIDVGASTRKYADLCQREIEEAFPGADVTVDYEEGAEGVPPRTYVTAPGDGYVDDREEPESVDNICSRIWEQMDWLIYYEE